MKKLNQRGALDMMLVIALVVVIGVGAFVIYRISETDVDEDNNSNSVASSMEADVLAEDLSGIKTLEEIQTIAAAEAGDAAIVGIELEAENDQTVYVIHLSDGNVLWFDATSGESVTLTNDDDDELDDDEAIPAGFVPGVSIQDAIEAAQGEIPGSDVEGVEIDVEDGVVVYSVRFSDDGRVDINAETGAIMDVREAEDDEAEHDESDEDAEASNEENDHGDDEHNDTGDETDDAHSDDEADDHESDDHSSDMEADEHDDEDNDEEDEE